MRETIWNRMGSLSRPTPPNEEGTSPHALVNYILDFRQAAGLVRTTGQKRCSACSHEQGDTMHGHAKPLADGVHALVALAFD